MKLNKIKDVLDRYVVELLIIKYYLNMGISKELTEEDIKFRYINEAITSKEWSKDCIFMEQNL